MTSAAALVYGWAVFSPAVLGQTARRALRIAADWRNEVPMTVTSATALAADGTPAWSVDFGRWMADAPRDAEDPRLRTTRALRQMRRIAPRMFDVSYRLLILGESVADCTRWLNERAQRNRIPLPPNRTAHYSEQDTIAILIGVCDFVWQSAEPA